MDCTQYTELMSAVLDGECTAQERLALERHLAVCPECAALFEILSANTKAARELDCEMPAGLKERILSSLPAQEAPARRGKLIRWTRWAPAAAAACLVLVLALTPALRKAGEPDLLRDAPEAAVSHTVEAPLTVDPKAGSDNPSVSEETAPGEAAPAHYFFTNARAIRVSYGSTPAPGAQIIGSEESLADYLSGFSGSGAEELDALAGTCTEEFFRTRRLLCVVVESGSGSNRYELASQGLFRSRVTVREEVPEVGTCDMAAWLLVAEVDSMFDDGDTLEVDFIH